MNTDCGILKNLYATEWAPRIVTTCLTVAHQAYRTKSMSARHSRKKRPKLVPNICSSHLPQHLELDRWLVPVLVHLGVVRPLTLPVLAHPVPVPLVVAQFEQDWSQFQMVLLSAPGGAFPVRITASLVPLGSGKLSRLGAVA